MKLMCIRHLPTRWNNDGILQGRRDIGILSLNESDRKKIRRNQEQLKKWEPFDLTCVSSLKRTEQTASLYGRRGGLIDPLLDELDFGAYEGQPKNRLLEDWGHDWLRDPRGLIFGEKVSDFEQRIKAFLEKYEELGKLLVFGHGGWIRGLLSILKYGDTRAMNQVSVNNNQLIFLDIGRKQA